MKTGVSLCTGWLPSLVVARQGTFRLHSVLQLSSEGSLSKGWPSRPQLSWLDQGSVPDQGWSSQPAASGVTEKTALLSTAQWWRPRSELLLRRDWVWGKDLRDTEKETEKRQWAGFLHKRKQVCRSQEVRRRWKGCELMQPQNQWAATVSQDKGESRWVFLQEQLPGSRWQNESSRGILRGTECLRTYVDCQPVLPYSPLNNLNKDHH